MIQKEKKSINFRMRALHRDIGFFAVGLVIIYALSGIVLVFRDTSFLKHGVQIEKILSPNIESSEIGKALQLKEFKLTKEDDEIIYFQEGTYNKTTGVANYTKQEIIFPLNRFIELHKSTGKGITHYFSVIFGGFLLFMVISSFWMYKKSSNLFRRGIYIAGAGVVLTLLLLLI